MKKVISIVILMGLVLFCLTGCEEEKTNSTSKNTVAKTNTTSSNTTNTTKTNTTSRLK